MLPCFGFRNHKGEMLPFKAFQSIGNRGKRALHVRILLQIKCAEHLNLMICSNEWRSVQLEVESSCVDKKGNAENGKSILLTIPTKRCLASYSSSAESKRLRIRAMLGYPDSGYMIPESCSRRLKEMGSRKNGHGAREGNTPLPLPSCVSLARLFLSCAVTSKHLLHRLSYL